MTSADSQPAETISAPVDGILLLDKPVGVSSFQALYPVKRAFRGSRIGHAGTLDPAASGLLVLGIGSGTRLLEFLEGLPKSYRFTLRLGLTTDTYDLDGEVLERRDASGVTREQLEALLPAFRGHISQLPPAYSAIKIEGKRACDRVRAGETVTLSARPVRVDRLEIVSFDDVNASAVLELDCSKGTYVRTIAHDLGRLLGCGAAAADIRRLSVGPFRVEDAVSAESLSAEALAPLESGVRHLPAVQVKLSWVAPLLHGNPVPPAGYTVFERAGYSVLPAGDSSARAHGRAPLHAIFSPAGKLIAVGELDPLGQLRPRKVFPDPETRRAG